MTLSVASLHIYPVKSLGGFSVKEARTTDRGFAHDRRWMLVDASGRFISQREQAALACLHCSPTGNGFRVTDIRINKNAVDLPWALDHGTAQRASVWGAEVDVLSAPVEISAWFADALSTTCALVYMPDHAHRTVDPLYGTALTSLSDDFPYLIVSQASMDDLNTRMTAPLPLDRFRSNIVVAGGTAFQEDTWKVITIGSARFDLVKPCTRCMVTTTDQDTGVRGKEPLRTLARYRRREGAQGEVNVDFGMNAMASLGHMVRVGDLVAP